MTSKSLTPLFLAVFGLAALTGEAAAFETLNNPSSDGSITDRLFQGQRITNGGCYYQLGMGEDGELKIYTNGGGSVKWSTNTGGVGAFAVMHHTGELVVRDWTGDAIWRSGTSGNPGAITKILDDGRGAVVSTTGAILYGFGGAGDSIGQTTCPISEKTRVHWDADMPGEDYESHWLSYSHMSSCGELCAADSLCQAFTYVPAGVQGNNARCWLKSNVPTTRTAHTGFVSGYKIREVPDNDW